MSILNHPNPTVLLKDTQHLKNQSAFHDTFNLQYTSKNPYEKPSQYHQQLINTFDNKDNQKHNAYQSNGFSTQLFDSQQTSQLATLQNRESIQENNFGLNLDSESPNSPMLPQINKYGEDSRQSMNNVRSSSKLLPLINSGGIYQDKLNYLKRLQQVSINEVEQQNKQHSSFSRQIPYSQFKHNSEIISQNLKNSTSPQVQYFNGSFTNQHNNQRKLINIAEIGSYNRQFSYSTVAPSDQSPKTQGLQIKQDLQIQRQNYSTSQQQHQI